MHIQNGQLMINNKPFFLQGMNLFLDSFRLERDPRRIYSPPVVTADLIHKIIPHLKGLSLNTVRIWPTYINGIHESSIEEEGLYALMEAGFHIVMNLPVNWHMKPGLNEIKKYIQRYSPLSFPNIDIYCISNESYHGFRTPLKYLQAVNHLVKRMTHRLTIMTNANLNHPFYLGADIVGADFFTYRYSISSQGYSDVGAVLRMMFEDAADVYRIFPKSQLLHFYPAIVKYLNFRAKHGNFDPKYFQKNLLKVLHHAQSLNKPYIVCEYGYVDSPELLDIIYAHMPLKQMNGHIWYNWSNFDVNISGKISNLPLYEKFRDICRRLGDYHRRLKRNLD